MLLGAIRVFLVCLYPLFHYWVPLVVLDRVLFGLFRRGSLVISVIEVTIVYLYVKLLEKLFIFLYLAVPLL